MNKIEGLLDQSDYEGYLDFINFRVDGYWLDEKLGELYPDQWFKGMVPTLVYWMERNDEKEVVWQRILPNENEPSVCPILMCPDDADFSCTIIVAEIFNFGEIIQWKRIGLNKTKEWEAEMVGTTVEWFEKFPVLNFHKSDYLQMLDNFRNRMEVDKKFMEKGSNSYRY